MTQLRTPVRRVHRAQGFAAEGTAQQAAVVWRHPRTAVLPPIAAPQNHHIHAPSSPRAARVLERYPANGKLLRCYGKFLEDVKHDPVAAARAYGEANRNGGGEGLLALDLSAVHGEVGKGAPAC